jgi:hypothetical protein
VSSRSTTRITRPYVTVRRRPAEATRQLGIELVERHVRTVDELRAVCEGSRPEKWTPSWCGMRGWDSSHFSRMRPDRRKTTAHMRAN